LDCIAAVDDIDREDLVGPGNERRSETVAGPRSGQPRQKPGSFSLDQVLEKLQEAGAGRR
jgi:hypothetical protein